MNNKVKQIISNTVLILFSITTLFPLVWMFYTSFKTNKEISASSIALPTSLHFENYVNAWNTAHMGTYFINSVVVTLVSVIITIIIGAAAAFILAKFQFKYKKAILALFITGMLIPMQSVLVPMFIQMRAFNLLDTRTSLVIAYVAFGLPITVFILEGFISDFDNAIIEAGVVDGCTIVEIFTKIIFPMSKPAISTAFILNALTNWKEFSFALVFISSDSKKTLPLGLYNFIGAYSAQYAELMAAMVISSLPLVLIYLILQEQIIKGMTDGAVKG